MFSPLIIALLTLQVSLLNQQIALANIQAPQVVMTPEEQAITQEFPDAPIMLSVAKCESGIKQFNQDGTVKENKTTEDFGLFQIHSSHLKEAQALGLDVRTLAGNVSFARRLYDEQGLKPWKSSQSCWLQGSTTDSGSTAHEYSEASEGERV